MFTEVAVEFDGLVVEESILTGFDLDWRSGRLTLHFEGCWIDDMSQFDLSEGQWVFTGTLWFTGLSSMKMAWQPWAVSDEPMSVPMQALFEVGEDTLSARLVETAGYFVLSDTFGDAPNFIPFASATERVRCFVLRSGAVNAEWIATGVSGRFQGPSKPSSLSERAEE